MRGMVTGQGWKNCEVSLRMVVCLRDLEIF